MNTLTPRIRLGCIADDFTGATDLANTLVRAGMRVGLHIGVPTEGAKIDRQLDAVVVALKTRTAPVDEAVSSSRAACAWLVQHGARQIYFKVCSTFDSTPRGNIGPVAEALASELRASMVPVNPAFPENGRTVFMGHLFVGEQLLHDSPMRDHPLTPMQDANLVRVLQSQRREGSTGLVTRPVVGRGAAALADRLQQLQRLGHSMAIVDAVDDADLQVLAEAVYQYPLVVAGSGLAIGLPHWHGCAPHAQAASLPPVNGASAVVAGSCSLATQAQVAHFVAEGGQSWALDPLRAAAGQDLVSEALAWAHPRLGEKPVLIHATADPSAVAAVQARLGRLAAGALVERTLADIVVRLVDDGVRRLVVAGGETSGACVDALGVAQLQVGPQIDPGIPWCHAERHGQGLHLALKSGNFGQLDFFSRAFATGIR